ncbi:hypothetical protein BDW71DRAFT_9002 [Aspergillus fruticulosus]
MVQHQNDTRKSEEVPDRKILPEAPASSSSPCCVSITSSSIGQLALTELEISTHNYPCAQLSGQSRAEWQSHNREVPVWSVCRLLARNESMRSRTVKGQRATTGKDPQREHAFYASSAWLLSSTGVGTRLWMQDLPAVFFFVAVRASPSEFQQILGSESLSRSMKRTTVAVLLAMWG